MIISVSRRSDIPAFYADWFIDKVKRSFIDVANPFNKRQVSRISLKKEDVDCFVFWSKYPYNLLKYLSFLDNEGYNYYFLFTLNNYPGDMEKYLPHFQKRIELFQDLSEKNRQRKSDLAL